MAGRLYAKKAPVEGPMVRTAESDTIPSIVGPLQVARHDVGRFYLAELVEIHMTQSAQGAFSQVQISKALTKNA